MLGQSTPLSSFGVMSYEMCTGLTTLELAGAALCAAPAHPGFLWMGHWTFIVMRIHG